MENGADVQMYLKMVGAILVILGCGGFGFKLAAIHIREEKTLKQLVSILDYMGCELQYRLTPLPVLCRQAAAESSGVIYHILLALATELEDQISPDVESCMNAALNRTKDVPDLTLETFKLLGHSLGRFDMDGQLKGLEAVRQECRKKIDTLNKNKDVRLRNYQTLGLCAGAALAILFI